MGGIQLTEQDWSDPASPRPAWEFLSPFQHGHVASEQAEEIKSASGNPCEKLVIRSYFENTLQSSKSI